MFTASHNPAQYNGIKLCRSGARPVGQDTGLAEVRTLAEESSPARSPIADDRRPEAHRSRRPRRLRRLPPLARRPVGHPPPQGRRRRRQRHGRLHRPRRPRHRRRPRRPSPRGRPALLRARRHLPQPRGQPARPEEPRRPPGRRPAARRRPRRRLRRRRRPLLRRRRARKPGEPQPITALIARREVARAVADGADAADVAVVHNVITSAAVPEVIAGHGRPRRAHPRGPLVHQGRDGPPRRRLRRRAQRALLLPRLLVRRHRDARGDARPRGPGGAGGAAEHRHGRPPALPGLRRVNSTVADAAAATEDVRAWAATRGSRPTSSTASP